MPSEFVVVERETFVSKFVSVTDAPETTAPFGSDTVPLTVPRLVFLAAATVVSKLDNKSVVSLNFMLKTPYSVKARASGACRAPAAAFAKVDARPYAPKE